MKRKILIGVAGGALALAMVGGAVYAGPSLERSFVSTTQAAAPTAQPGGNPTDAGAGRTGRGQQRGKAALLTGALIKASAEVTATQPKDVLAALRDGKSLAQYAQAHGKTADDILAKLRELGQQRLDKALDRAKDLIDKPGLGRNPNGGASTSGGANK